MKAASSAYVRLVAIVGCSPVEWLHQHAGWKPLTSTAAAQTSVRVAKPRQPTSCAAQKHLAVQGAEARAFAAAVPAARARSAGSCTGTATAASGVRRSALYGNLAPYGTRHFGRSLRKRWPARRDIARRTSRLTALS